MFRGKEYGLPLGVRIIVSPDDLDARPGIKRGRTWCGYMAHLTVVCDLDRPHLITHGVATTDASTSGLDTVEERHDALVEADLLAERHADVRFWLGAATRRWLPMLSHAVALGPRMPV